MLRKRRAVGIWVLGAILAAGSGWVEIAASDGPSHSAVAVFDGIDNTITPGQDFFAFANGAWIKSTAIPQDRAAYGVGYELIELTDQRTADLVQELSGSDAAPGSEAAKIRDYYASFMDEAVIEQRGIAPLRPQLAAIDAIRTRSQLAHYLGKTLRADVDVLNATVLDTDNLFGLWIAQDHDDPASYAPFLLQGGLGMPDRDYYQATTAGLEETRRAYREHVAAMLKLAGYKEPAAMAARVYGLEERIAAVHETRSESEDVAEGNNHWPRTEFARRAAGLDWPEFFRGAQLTKSAVLVVWQPAAIAGTAALAASEPLTVWRDYLRYHALHHVAALLPAAFVAETFAFYGRTLNGTPQLRARWKRAVRLTNDALGEAIGKLYVARYFPPADKRRAEIMVENLLAAFAARIDRLDWMTPETKAKARAKLATLKVGVGYPNRWRDYRALTVVRGDAFGNAERAERFEYERNLHKLGTPVDLEEWVMTPQTVNAVNLPAMNALNFPAATLQPPLFDPRRSDASNYGATGATIGHEISHSFDDQGAQFDARGRLRNWWTPQDLAHFSASGVALVRQFDAYRPFTDLNVRGRQTLSENIADLAGLADAYDAFRRLPATATAPVVDGYTPDQQFFLAYAQSWREKIREPARRQQLLTDGHAPAEYRADTVRNLDAWYEAFDVRPEQALYLAPSDRVRVW